MSTMWKGNGAKEIDDYFFKCDTCAIEYTNPPRGQTAPTTGPNA
jgi:hypothetical protein